MVCEMYIMVTKRRGRKRERNATVDENLTAVVKRGSRGGMVLNRGSNALGRGTRTRCGGMCFHERRRKSGVQDEEGVSAQ